ncbi:serine-rich adhesin for platelets-like [Macrobrachium nipponense]|uniref:serine-rich adhesin for platelets-like n=1 Tax=Macrobrachium nipponense TaxID=159736 RepID=UPI0030C7A254
MRNLLQQRQMGASLTGRKRRSMYTLTVLDNNNVTLSNYCGVGTSLTGTPTYVYDYLLNYTLSLTVSSSAEDVECMAVLIEEFVNLSVSNAISIEDSAIPRLNNVTDQAIVHIEELLCNLTGEYCPSTTTSTTDGTTTTSGTSTASATSVTTTTPDTTSASTTSGTSTTIEAPKPLGNQPPVELPQHLAPHYIQPTSGTVQPHQAPALYQPQVELQQPPGSKH